MTARLVGVILTSGAVAIAVVALVVAALWLGYRGRPVVVGETVSLDELMDGDDGYLPRHLVRNDETVLIPAVTP